MTIQLHDCVKILFIKKYDNRKLKFAFSAVRTNRRIAQALD